ncbi:MAG: HAMP domain-containing protein [Gemmatimonadota bacterium]|nr:MAG: HAMP domain-containing protein [Gemmatimonadota bacterium]
MTRIPSLSSITSSLSFRLFLVLFLSIVLMFAAYAAIGNHLQSRILEQQARAEAARHGDLIRQGLHDSMMLNERERTYAYIKLIGDEPGIEAIRIYDKQGVIQYSNDESEIGTSVDLRAEACYVCHASSDPLQAVPTEERSRIYHKQDSDYRVLGLITPIHNESSCWSAECHAHDASQSILGVLDVQLAMEEVDQAFATASRQAVTLSVAIIFLALFLIAAIVYRAVYRPTQRLRRGTEALARGNLDVQIELDQNDELGQLAQSFNDMASSLKKADTELRDWSRTLEDRVNRKTAELERIHSQMMQVEKAASLGRMAATVAHELNNPLSGILTCAKLAEKRVDRLEVDEKTRQGVLENLELIRSESMRCGNIVRDLLTYARESASEFQRIHLHQLVERALKLVGHHIELGEIATDAQLELEDDLVICDGDQVIQALIALIINAVEAMPGGGRLTIKTWEASDGRLSRVGLSVGDTGVGISEEIREHIFDPFFSTKEDTRGVGLGLAVVYGIVQRHQGKISVASKLGEGTTFTLEMPRDPQQAARDSRQPATTVK